MSAADDLRDFADAVEKAAFEIPAPNPYTPRFVHLAVLARQKAQVYRQEEYKLIRCGK